MRRLLHILSIALITAGVVVLADAGLTLAYKEPLSSIYSSIRQGEKESQLKSIESRFLSQAEVRSIDHAVNRAKRRKEPRALHENIAKLAQKLADASKPGDALGRIEAPGMGGLDMVFVQGTDDSSLQLGPGHYPETAMPGQGRTVAIAGHRTTYLAPFRHIDSMKPGERITLRMPYGNFVYGVQKSAIVEPTDVGIIHDTGYERLVLSACNPLYSAAQRYIIFARLVHTEPRTAG